MRIRSVKPEFWSDEDIGALSREARLLFIATWNLADDEGLLRWTPAYIKASVFMYDDDIDGERLKCVMAELVDNGSIFPYVAGKTRQSLAFVVKFRSHQRVNRPQGGKLPPPPWQDPVVRLMYARRDGFECHLCRGPVNHEFAPPVLDPYASDVRDTSALDPSCDHLVTREAGGHDYPSNIATAHVACNKGRGSRPVEGFTPPASVVRLLGDALPQSVTHSLNDSVNESAPTHTPTAADARNHSVSVQGAGSREQGAGSRMPPKAGVASAPPDETEGQRINRLTKTYADVVPLSNFPAVSGVVRKAVRANRYSDEQITEALARLAGDVRSVTTDSLRIELEGRTPLRAVSGSRPSVQTFTDEDYSSGF